MKRKKHNKTEVYTDAQLTALLKKSEVVISSSKNDNKNGEIKTSTSENPKNLPSSGGKTLEMILVIPDEIYKGELKDSIGGYFMKACEGLSQPEPLFDVVQMNPNAFFKSEMFQKHRNVFRYS